ncbi:MAG: hypothetical protein OHK0039_38230 [Bacteroidia bacterium]
MNDPDSHLSVSVVSLWELAIKINIGKLQLAYALDALIQSLETQGFIWCPITQADLTEYMNLPLHHRDPFDRTIIAQAIARGCTLISSDQTFKAYPVPVIWKD